MVNRDGFYRDFKAVYMCFTCYRPSVIFSGHHFAGLCDDQGNQKSIKSNFSSVKIQASDGDLWPF